MQSIRDSSIRRIYYFSFLILAGVMVLALAVPFVFSQRDDYFDKIELVTSTVMDQKQQFIRTVVHEKISDIDAIRLSTIREFEKNVGIVSRTFASTLEVLSSSQQIFLSGFRGSSFLLEEFLLVEVVIYDQRTGDIVLSSLDDDEMTNFDPSQDFEFSSRTALFSSLEVLAFVPIAVVESVIEERMKENIRRTELPDSGYVWVNQVLDFGGGDKYAIRLVHPNLPDTEGMLLSTDMDDGHGTKPFQLELDGINEAGEVFFQYYFKKLNSDEVSRKLSYAKLYDHFDWIVATGIHLDDIDRIIEEEKINLNKEIRRDILVITSVSLLLLLLFAYFLMRFESQLEKLISWQKSTLEDQNRELTRLAYFDPLTNLWNRRAMYNRFEEEMSRSKRTGHSLCLIITDIDFFKAINDSYGHDAGDYVLQQVAKLLKEQIRGEDVVSRWGGEEFLILMNNTSLEEGTSIAEKLRLSIEETLFRYEETDMKLTMTFGVSLSSAGENIHQAVKQADQRLYRGKEEGRNRVVNRD